MEMTIEELTTILIEKWEYKHPDDIHKLIRGIVRRQGKVFARKLLIKLINQDINQ